MINRNIKRGLILSSCVLMCLTAVGCSSGKKSDSSKKNVETQVSDIRTAKIINQQQAILNFTTKNKAGSVVSIKLVPSGDSYTYTLIAVDKKGIEHIYTIDAKSGKVVKTEDKGPIDKANPPQYIDFVPVIDIDKAGKNALKFAKDKDMIEIVSYKLYSDGGKNIYLITLSNGEEGDSKKTEKIMIDAFTGKVLTEADIKAAEENQKAEEAKKAAEKQKAAQLKANTTQNNAVQATE